MKILLVRYPETLTEVDLKLLREEMKGAIRTGESHDVGLALIREDIKVVVLDLDADTEYEEEEY